MNITDEQGVKWLLQKAYEVGYRYVAMDKNGGVFLFKNKPYKLTWGWSDGEYDCDKFPMYICESVNLLVSWEDEEPFDIGKYIGVVDWENVPVDTKVLVSDDGKNWGRRYFKCYNKLIRKNNEEYPYACFLSGCTSWSIGEECDETSWKYCKLAEDE